MKHAAIDTNPIADETARIDAADITIIDIFDKKTTNDILQLTPVMKAAGIIMPKATYLLAAALLIRYVDLAMLLKVPKERISATAQAIIRDRIEAIKNN